jgi:galactokinase/mevalonate kinase-like predicted kinase
MLLLLLLLLLLLQVRKGESLTDIISKRNISRAEMSNLNTGVNLDKLKGAGGGGNQNIHFSLLVVLWMHQARIKQHL